MTQGNDGVVTLVDEEGVEHDFVLLDIIVVNKNEYAIMVPAEDAELENGEAEEQEAVIFRIDENEDGEQTLVAIDDDEEWDSVAAAWEEQAEYEEE
ncbi:MAG: DUF1292 domain-containing protein [Bacillota bacterium]|jgi:putative Holliday junction resolvase|nr:DUF1292 domain-containing protein [Bacillota bacterium]HHU30185.1 DUF1292 domain-containing protein [Bacillota bacterium]